MRTQLRFLHLLSNVVCRKNVVFFSFTRLLVSVCFLVCYYNNNKNKNEITQAGVTRETPRFPQSFRVMSVTRKCRQRRVVLILL